MFRDSALCAETKKLSSDPLGATAKSLLERLSKQAKRNKKKITATQTELNWIVNELAADLLRGPSHLQKSVQLGWELAATIWKMCLQM